MLTLQWQMYYYKCTEIGFIPMTIYLSLVNNPLRLSWRHVVHTWGPSLLHWILLANSSKPCRTLKDWCLYFVFVKIAVVGFTLGIVNVSFILPPVTFWPNCTQMDKCSILQAWLKNSIHSNPMIVNVTFHCISIVGILWLLCYLLQYRLHIVTWAYYGHLH